jgi:SAM-dependent methyltransferase
LVVGSIPTRPTTSLCYQARCHASVDIAAECVTARAMGSGRVYCRRVANEKNRAHWNQSGVTWVAHQRTFDRVLEPIADLLLDAAAPGAGDRVLDVGCGAGTTALAAVGRGAIVHGIDISDSMVDAARMRVPSATFDVVDAQTDPLGGPFDSVISRFGVMFFDDPVAAFANIARHVEPGGRMTFVCWNDQARSTAAWAGAEVLRAALPSPPPPLAADAPGPFALADAQRTEQLLATAGWADISISAHELPCELGWPNSDGVEERLAIVLESEAGQLMRDQIPEVDQAAPIEAARASLRGRVVDGTMRLHASVWLVTALRER